VCAVAGAGETSLQDRLYPGDEIISANNIDLTAMSQHEAWTLLKSMPDRGKVTMEGL